MADCKYGDPYCPCQEGDACHYEGKNAMAAPASPGIEQERLPGEYTLSQLGAELLSILSDYDDPTELVEEGMRPWFGAWLKSIKREVARGGK